MTSVLEWRDNRLFHLGANVGLVEPVLLNGQIQNWAAISLLKQDMGDLGTFETQLLAKAELTFHLMVLLGMGRRPK